LSKDFFTKIQLWREKELAMIAFDNSKQNLFDEQLMQQFSAAISLAQTDDKVRVIGVTGSGEAYFSAGVAWDTLSSFISFIEMAHSVSSLMLSTTKPIIAMVNGDALGAGFELVLQSDFKLFADDAVVGFPEYQHGYPSVMGGFLAACETCGATWAKRLFTFGENLTAKAAKSIGLADEVFPKQDFFGDCGRWVEKLVPKLTFFPYVKNIGMDPARLSLMREIEREMACRLMGARDSRDSDGLKRARDTRCKKPAEM
jgi:enoyl-CoA hydratase/carnithine racemase